MGAAILIPIDASSNKDPKRVSGENVMSGSGKKFEGKIQMILTFRGSFF
jgi:hypothetical protein